MNNGDIHIVEPMRPEDVLYESIRKMGMQNYVNSLSNFGKAFQLTELSAGCTDEGMIAYLRDPGVGIIECAKNPDAMYNVAKRLCGANIDHLKGHGGCGAGKDACRIALGLQEGAHIDSEIVDSYVLEHIKTLAEVMEEISGKKITYEFVPETDLKRPAGYHPARSLVINTTEYPFIPCDGFPQSFVLSAADFKRDHVLDSINVVLSIAFGEKGYKGGFSWENPFHITLIKDPHQPGISYKLKEKLKNIVDNPAYEYHGKIQLNEFTAPKEYVRTYPHSTLFESVGKTVREIEDACLAAFDITPSPNPDLD